MTFAPAALQCSEISHIFGHISNATFLDKPITLMSDTDAIRSSYTFQCVVAFLMAQTTLILFNVDGSVREVREPAYGLSQIVFYGNLAKFERNRWLWTGFRNRKLLNSYAHILVIAESYEHSIRWLKAFYDGMLAVRVTVAVMGEGGGFYTWFPYQSGECGNVSTLVKLEQPQLFPHKSFIDLQGCNISSNALKVPPFVIDEYNGIEVQVARAIGRKLNANIQIRILNLGDILTQALAVKRFLYANRADFQFGAIPLFEQVISNFEMATGHAFEVLTYICPSPRPINRMVLIVRAFPLDLWFLVIAMYFAITLTCYFLKDNSSALRAWSILLGQSYGMVRLSRKNMFETFCTFLAMGIIASYQACLFKLLQTIPREKPFQSYEELLESDYIYYDTSSDPASFFPRPEKIRKVPHLAFNELADGISYAMLPPSIFLYYAQNRSLYTDELGYPKHIIMPLLTYTVSGTFLLTQGHPLRDVFAKNIRKLFEGGLPNYWKTEFFQPTADYGKHVKVPISLVNLEGAFYVLLSLLTLALLIFSVEGGLISLKWVICCSRLVKMKEKKQKEKETRNEALALPGVV